MSKQRKSKLTLRTEGLSWLAQRTADSEWKRVLDLYDRGQIPALLDYLKGITSPETFAEFEQRNLPPEVLAERRRIEAEKRQAEEDAARTIHNGKLPAVHPTTAMLEGLEGKGWHPAEHTIAKERERAAAEEREKREVVLVGPQEISW